MPHRDALGHFISEEEARRRSMLPEEAEEDEEDDEDTETPYSLPLRWADETPRLSELVYVETGRGQTAEVRAGSPFRETVERIAEEAHYGGYFRVFLNGEELRNPEESPETIEPGMRVALTAYDKVG